MTTTTTTERTLQPKHRDELHASGISDDMIAAAGIYSANRELRDVLGWMPQGLRYWGDGWVIPYRDADDPAFARVKLDAPRKDKDGKPIKYESPKDKPNPPYFPPGFWEAIQSPDAPIFITEGEKKALSAACNGFACIGLPGVWNFAPARPRRGTGRATGPRLLMASLNRIQWNGRKVYIVFDSDREEKKQVRQAERELAEILVGRGAQVHIVKIPPAEGGGKVGLDDYLVAHGADAFRKLTESAPEASVEDRERTESSTPMALADKYISTKLMHADGCILRHWREEFWQWDGRRYRQVTDGDFTRRVLVWADTQVDRATPRLAENVSKCISARVLVDASREIPLYHGTEGPADPRDWLAMENGILDLRGLLEGNAPQLRDHSPRWFSPVCLPYPFIPEADCPRWRAFLDEVMEGDEDRLDLLAEWAGYNLVPDVSMHKFALLEGEGANGKSVFLKVLEALIGPDNVSHVMLEMFGMRFQLAPIIGKLANIVPEVSELAKPDEAIFKAMVAGDPVLIDRKSKPPVTCSPTARVTIATNTRPRWADRSDGIWRRMLLIPFRVSIPEDRQDRHLADYIIEHELPGVFNWAVRGLRNLRQRGRFTDPDVCREAIADYRQETNPARTFLLEECQAAPGAWVKSERLYKFYRDWCEEHGYRALSSQHFGQEVRRVYTVERVQHWEGGRRYWFLYGIRCQSLESVGA